MGYDHRQGGGAWFSLKFRVGVCRPQFQHLTIGCETLARLILHQKCCELALSRQNLPNFHILWTKIKKIGASLQELPNFDISLTKIAKKYTLG